MDSDSTTWLGLAGIVLGAVLGYGSSVVQEARRQRHENELLRLERARDDSQRLQDRRFDAFVALITAANKVYAAVKHPLAGDVTADHLREAYESFMGALSPAFMVTADLPSREVIAALARVVRQLVEAVIDDASVDTDFDATLAPVDTLLRAHRQCVKQVEAVMRVELGIVDV